jgi:DNA-binding CsgD family transcriptional regulator
MQTWVVETSSPHRMVDAKTVAALVDAIGSQDPELLASCILAAVRPVLDAKQCTVFAHEAQRNPRLLSWAAEGGPLVAFHSGAQHAREFASQDALRQVIDRKPAVGPVGVTLVARQTLEEMPIGSYRRECMEAIGLVDRLTLLVRTGESCWVTAHLYRDKAHGPFDVQQIEGLIGVATLLACCIARHYASDANGVASLRGSVSEGVTQLGPRLSAREHEVLTRILDGVSVDRIAEDLKLRSTTVATYRMRAYEKLGVASRQELFATVLRWRAMNPTAAPARVTLPDHLVQNSTTLLQIG